MTASRPPGIAERQPDAGRPRQQDDRERRRARSTATSNIWNAGRIEMNAIEMPASVPSIAARGVYLRIVGPTNAPIRTITPMMNAQASPACQASIGVAGPRRTIGSMITKVTKK